MKVAWILRIAQRRVTIGGSRSVVILRVTPDGEETELEKLHLESGGPYLRDVVKGQIAKERRLLILDLSFVPYLDSSGLGEIVSAFVHAGRADGSLVLACLSPRAREVIRLMNLEGVILSFDSVAAAARHYCS